MRRLEQKSTERLRHVLQQAFAEQKQVEFKPSEFWHVGVMSEIRRIGRLNAEIEYWTLFEKLIWKFIPAAVALVLLLGVAFTQIDSPPENIIADIYAEESIDSGLYAFYDQQGTGI